LANGHQEAWSYPLGLLWVESQIVVERENASFATTAMLVRMAISSIPSPHFTKQANKTNAKAFDKQIKALIGEK
jgi:hypothetical protein